MSRILRPGLALPLVAVFAIAPLAATTPAGQTSAALPAARTIIDRHIKEIGGRAVILAQTSTHATGTVSLPAAGLSGKLEAFHAKPDKFVQRMSLPGIGDIEEGFDGKVGWSISPLTGPTLLDGKQLEQRKFDADFFEDLKASDRYASITTVEKTTFVEAIGDANRSIISPAEGRPVYKIRLLKKAGDEDLELYDSETGLKVGAISTRDSPMGPMQTTTAWSDYRKFGRLLQPATTKVSVMSTQMILSITGVEYGTVDPAVFTVPAQIKALVK